MPLLQFTMDQCLGGCATARGARIAAFLAIVGWSILGRSLVATGQNQVPGLGRLGTGQDAISEVYLPTDRSLSRAMTRVRERLAEKEYQQAISFLQDILQREEDSFLEEPDGPHRQVGLKSAARRLIGELPAEGHAAYELLHGAAARRQLSAALASGDESGIAGVVRQYYHTSAGYEATLVLAQMESDQGHHLAAAQLYEELIDTPLAAARFEPQLSALAALNQLAANSPETAAARLRSLVEKQPNASIELLGQKLTIPTVDDLATWLSQRAGQPIGGKLTKPHFAGEGSSAGEQQEWLSVRGNAARSADHPGGRPHLRARWEARVVNDPSVEAYLAGRSDEFAQRHIAIIPAAQPIALADVVVMRTQQNVVAVDWETGKRVWETRDDEDLEPNEFPSNFPAGLQDERLALQGNSLEQRVWDDALAMSLASDGKRVYVLRSDAGSPRDELMTLQMMPFNNRGIPEITAATNQLAAYDVSTQGKLVWELDGARTVGSLAGAFFLGAPLAVDDTLYVMAEIRSAIYLLALQPETGEVRWQQQLAGLEQGISLDPARRLIGATPSYAGGILVCPTAAGAVIAVDVVKRELAWAYRYRSETPSPAEFRNPLQQQIQNQSPRTNDRWLDGSAIIDDGRVFVTPPESADLHCLDLHTGKQLWTHRQGDAMFVACIDQDRLLLVGTEAVQALRVADGTPGWETRSVPLPSGTLPAGYGYLSDGVYYLPLTSGAIAAIDMASGTLTESAPGPKNQTLGNLICYRGSVISQSALTLNKFEQLEMLEKRATAALAKNPNDASALRDVGELKHSAGKPNEAIAALKRAFELAPDDPLTREMLADMLLEALSVDYSSFQEDVPLAARLVRDRDRQLQLLRIEAEGLQRLGDYRRAWNAYLRLADATVEEPAILTIDGDHSVRSDRWICGRLVKLWDDATAEDRANFEKELGERRARLAQTETSAELRHYLVHFELLPGAGEVQRKLATFLLAHGRPLEAEIELLQMASSKDTAQQAAAAVLFAKSLLNMGNAADAAPLLSLLEADYGDVVALDGLTGSEWLKRLRSDAPLKELSSDDWPRGHVEAEIMPAAVQERPRANRPQERQPGYGQLRIEQDYWPVASVKQWFISQDCAKLIGRNALGKDVVNLSLGENSWARQYRQNDIDCVYAARLGHVLVVTLGSQIVAIDTRQKSASARGYLLWQTSSLGSSPAAVPTRRVMLGRLSPMRANRRPIYHQWSSRKRMTGVVGRSVGSLGPATPRGVVYQEEDTLKCVDPLSGETLWSRSDLPSGCELFGDQEFVFAADVSEHVAYVFRMVDGELAGKRELPKPEWLLTAGRNLAQLASRTEGDRRTLVLQITDAWSQEPLLEAEYPINSRATVVEPHTVAMFDPSGKFQLIDVQTGRVRSDVQLDAAPDLRSIHLVRSGDVLFLFAGSQPARPQQSRPVDPLDGFVASGNVYALSLKSGQPLWPGPATIRNRGLVAQPEDIPLLIFLDRQVASAGRGGRPHLRLLCIDRRTGESVYRNDSLPDTPVTRLRIRGQHEATPLVTIETNAGTIRLAITDLPRPPRPAANDDLEAARDNDERGLLGLGRRLSAALRGTIEQRPTADPMPLPVNGPRTPPEVPEAMDDD